MSFVSGKIYLDKYLPKILAFVVWPSVSADATTIFNSDA
jgi:hypothetical protein